MASSCSDSAIPGAATKASPFPSIAHPCAPRPALRPAARQCASASASRISRTSRPTSSGASRGSERLRDRARLEGSMNQDCACLCGASRLTVTRDPIGRFFCHCTICQKVYGKPFADVTYFWAESVALPVSQDIVFRRYRPPPALRRGVCAKCGNPIVGFLRLAPGLMLAFVPSQNFPRPAELAAPNRHIFYDRRVEDIPDSIPKLEGYWASEAYSTRSVLAAFFGRTRAPGPSGARSLEPCATS